MANLGYFKIDTKGEYVKLSDITGVTLTSGTAYIFQIRNPPCIMIESNTVPEEGGIEIDNTKPFGFTAGDTPLYIKTDYMPIRLNISV